MEWKVQFCESRMQLVKCHTAVIRWQEHNKYNDEPWIRNINSTQTTCYTGQKTLHALWKNTAQRDSRTYLIKAENRYGQMSKQKTVFCLRRPERKRGTDRERRTLRQKRQQRENTQRGFVRQQSSMRLDPPADQQCSDESGPVARYMAQWWLEGGTFWESWWNATHGACSGRLMKQPETSGLH